MVDHPHSYPLCLVVLLQPVAPGCSWHQHRHVETEEFSTPINYNLHVYTYTLYEECKTNEIKWRNRVSLLSYFYALTRACDAKAFSRYYFTRPTILYLFRLLSSIATNYIIVSYHGKFSSNKYSGFNVHLETFRNNFLRTFNGQGMRNLL